MARDFVAAVSAEYERYKALGEGAMAQLTDAQLNQRAGDESNSAAMICWHMSGNFASRFSDFLTTDGEKSWRAREEEFADRSVTRAELIAKWEAGWSVLLTTLSALNDADLDRVVTIRRQPLPVRDALLRSLAHASYHVGQIVYLAKMLRKSGWRHLSIPPGQSDAYNRNPTYDKPNDFVAHLKGQ